MHIQILQIPPVSANPLDLRRQREAAFPKMTNSHRFYSSKNQRRENLQISNPSPSLRDGTALCSPKPSSGTFPCERDSSCSRIISLPNFWHHLACFCPFQPDFFSFPSCTKPHCPPLKVSPWMGAAFVTKASVPCSSNSKQLSKKLR